MNYDDQFSGHAPHTAPDGWQEPHEDDDFEIASETGMESEQSRGILRSVKLFLQSITGKISKKTDHLNDSSFGDSAGFEISPKGATFSEADDFQEDSRDFEIASSTSGNQSGPASNADDDYAIASKSGTALFSDIDEQSPDSMVSIEPPQDDFVVLSDKKSSQNLFHEHITVDQVEIIRDEFEIAENSKFSTNETAGVDESEFTSQSAGESPFDDFGTDDPERQKLRSVLQEQLSEFMANMDKVHDDFQDDGPGMPAGMTGKEDGLTAASVSDQRPSFVPLIASGFLRIFKWLTKLPLRALSDSGPLSESKRSRIEPLFLGLPALCLLVSIYLTQIRFQTKNLLSESAKYSKLTSQKLKSGDFQAALLAARQLCSKSKTPANLWRLSEVLLTSKQPAGQSRAIELIRSLAAPENGDFADAHLFLARKAWNSEAMKVEEVPGLLNQVKFHLRSGLTAEPNRVDLLEMLLDLLMTTGEFPEVIRLATPRLETWPTGYYYLARVAFKQGDRLNQEIYAKFIVNRYESLSGVIAESTEDRERYLICLALSGQWSKAEPLLNDWLRELDGEKAVLFWKNRFLAIKALSLLEAKPADYQSVVNDVINAIAKSPDNQELWNALTRFADKKSPLSDQFYREGIRLIGKNKKVLDSTELMIWGNLARKKNEPIVSRELLEESVRRNPENIIATNNLANLLYKIEPKDPARALKLIDKVVQSEPDNLIFIETRGQILAALGQDNQAISDLTRSLSAFPEVGEIHETLIRLYHKNGQTDLARIHEKRLREIAEKLQKQLEDQQSRKPDSGNVKQ
ncbi:MAG: tetratricopeptide repeat protein [bacterium]